MACMAGLLGCGDDGSTESDDSLSCDAITAVYESVTGGGLLSAELETLQSAVDALETSVGGLGPADISAIEASISRR